MTDRPLLLLDVDGPLNPHGARLLRPQGYTTHRFHPAIWLARQTPGSRRHRRGLRVRLNPGHGARLTALPYELAWATTWMHQANEMIAPAIGLPRDLPVIEWPELFTRDPEGLYWKTRHILAWAAGRPFAWVDDLITHRDTAHVATHHDAPALLLRIDPRRGLRDDDFARLEGWARDL
ncbi:HAD domain-containing protein [Streptomyces sp. NPDC047108]|uniref:HAD domain-containing protein n=1 Tax=Streptomyces sp. NPDC047108 TaxID=3155025 RepID=UPI00340F6A21